MSKGIQRWDLIDECPDGDWVDYDDHLKAVAEAVAQEREECADLCDGLANQLPVGVNLREVDNALELIIFSAARYRFAAKAIRSRNKEPPNA